MSPQGLCGKTPHICVFFSRYAAVRIEQKFINQREEIHNITRPKNQQRGIHLCEMVQAVHVHIPPFIFVNDFTAQEQKKTFVYGKIEYLWITVPVLWTTTIQDQ